MWSSVLYYISCKVIKDCYNKLCLKKKDNISSNLLKSDKMKFEDIYLY